MIDPFCQRPARCRPLSFLRCVLARPDHGLCDHGESGHASGRAAGRPANAVLRHFQQPVNGKSTDPTIMGQRVNHSFTINWEILA